MNSPTKRGKEKCPTIQHPAGWLWQEPPERPTKLNSRVHHSSRNQLTWVGHNNVTQIHFYRICKQFLKLNRRPLVGPGDKQEGIALDDDGFTLHTTIKHSNSRLPCQRLLLYLTTDVFATDAQLGAVTVSSLNHLFAYTYSLNRWFWEILWLVHLWSGVEAAHKC